jgi:vacuolar-type H+-ATPase subunit H
MTWSNGNGDGGGTEPADMATAELTRLQQAEAEIEARGARILEEARQRAAEIVRQAEAEADRLQSAQAARDREIFSAISDRIVSMGDAYREAMIGARQAVERVAELARQATAAEHVTPDGPHGGPAPPPAAVDSTGIDPTVLPG